jgi:hypothetical protein
MQRDEFCTLLSSVEISYARRAEPSLNPYPPSVPSDQSLSTYNSSQQDLRLVETRQSVYKLIDPQAWRLGLPYQQRQNVITNPTGYTDYPANARGLDYEALHLPNGVLGPDQTRMLSAQNGRATSMKRARHHFRSVRRRPACADPSCPND